MAHAHFAAPGRVARRAVRGGVEPPEWTGAVYGYRELVKGGYPPSHAVVPDGTLGLWTTLSGFESLPPSQ